MIDEFIMIFLNVILVDVEEFCYIYWIFGVFVVDDKENLVGIIMNCDMCFEDNL